MEFEIINGAFKFRVSGEFNEVKEMVEVADGKGFVDQAKIYATTQNYTISEKLPVAISNAQADYIVSEIPELMEIIKSNKSNSFTEPNWILIHAFYLYNENGQQPFTEKELREHYLKNRTKGGGNWTKNFSSLVGKKVFKYIGEQIVLTDDGTNEAKKLLLQENDTVITKTKKSKAKTIIKNTTAKIDLELSQEIAQKIIDEFKSINLDSNTKKMYALMSLYREYAQKNEFNKEIMSALFDVVGLSAPTTIGQMLINEYGAKKLEKTETGNYKIKLSFEAELKEIVGNKIQND
jgi:ribosomal protein S20